jgi:hypothetical protein
MDQITADCRGRVSLPPAAPPIEAAATKQKNDDYDDKKRGHVHGFSFLRQSVSRGILARLAANLTLPAAFLLRPPASVRVRCSRPKFGKRRRRSIGCSAFSLPDKTTSASHPLAVCTGYCTYRTRKFGEVPSTSPTTITATYFCDWLLLCAISECSCAVFE